MTNLITAGFADPTRDAQHAFRAVLEALARPTRRYPLAGPSAAPEALGRAAAAVALTLCDEQTPVWLDPALSAAGVREWFAFHTGARVVESPAAAAFAFASGLDALPPFADFAQGTHEAPHTSTTIVLDVRAARGDAAFRASGPGILGSAPLAATWADAGFLAQWRRNAEAFPLGIDLVLVAEDEVSGLPRTTRLEPAETARAADGAGATGIRTNEERGD
ncbi:MAG TPA: phosphonate C-P lyase system protein PhnH [Gryllotalpicola sp.]